MNRDERLEHYVKIVLLLIEEYPDRDKALIDLAARCFEERRKHQSSQYRLVLRDDAITEVDSPDAKAIQALAEVRRKREDNAVTEPGNAPDGRYESEIDYAAQSELAGERPDIGDRETRKMKLSDMASAIAASTDREEKKKKGRRGT